MIVVQRSKLPASIFCVALPLNLPRIVPLEHAPRCRMQQSQASSKAENVQTSAGRVLCDLDPAGRHLFAYADFLLNTVCAI